MPNVYPVTSIVVPYKRGPSSQHTYVMVREKDSGLWGQPGGGIDFADKDWVTAAGREVFEECGLTVSIEGLIGFYSYPSKNGNRILGSSFLGKYIEGDLRTQSDDIIEVKDMTLSEIRDLGRKDLLRSDKANIKPIEDYLRRGIFSLDEIFHFLG